MFNTVMLTYILKHFSGKTTLANLSELLDIDISTVSRLKYGNKGNQYYWPEWDGFNEQVGFAFSKLFEQRRLKFEEAKEKITDMVDKRLTAAFVDSVYIGEMKAEINAQDSIEDVAAVLVSRAYAAHLRYSDKAIDPKAKKETKIKLTSLLPDDDIELFGRENELQDLGTLVKKHRRVAITGPHGIGKTALLRAFCCDQKTQDNFSTILYIPVSFNLLLSFSDDDLFPIEEILDSKFSMTENAYGILKFDVLRASVSPSTLLVLDGVSKDDALLPQLLKLGCHVLLSGTDFVDGIKKFELGPLAMIPAQELFASSFGSLSKEDLLILPSLLQDTSPFAVKVSAKYMRFLGKSPSHYQNVIQVMADKSQFESFLPWASPELKNAYSSITELFDKTELTEDEIGLLQILSLMPPAGIQTDLLRELYGGIPTLPANLKYLEEIGFIEVNQHAQVSLPSLLRDIIFMKFDISLSSSKCISKFTASLTKQLRLAYENTYAQNVRYKNIAYSVYVHFPKPTLENYRFYQTLSSYFATVNMQNISELLQEQITRIFDENAPYWSEAGEAHLYKGLFAAGYKKKTAYKEFEKAVAIFANRYATACSHLAEMMDDDRVTAQQLFKESLSLREKYVPHTISHAAALHQYAKVLVKWGEFEKALELENKAAEIFADLQPDGVNLSSTCFLTGWIEYNCSSDDPTKRKRSIDLMEMALQIRLRFREKTHPWFEEFYQKLASVYLDEKNIEKGMYYLELLLECQKEKYGSYHAPKVQKTMNLLQQLQSHR